MGRSQTRVGGQKKICKLLYHRKCKRRGVGGQKKPNLVNVACERLPIILINFPWATSNKFFIIEKSKFTHFGSNHWTESWAAGWLTLAVPPTHRVSLFCDYWIFLLAMKTFRKQRTLIFFVNLFQKISFCLKRNHRLPFIHQRSLNSINRYFFHFGQISTFGAVFTVLDLLLAMKTFRKQRKAFARWSFAIQTH